MPGCRRFGDRRLILIILLILVLALAVASTAPTHSFFSRTTTVSRNVISFGTWGPVPSVCKVCPCFGVSGICAWAVFLYGNNLCKVSSIKLVKGSTTVVAKKLWHIGDGVLYCVFNLRSVPGGSYDIVAKTASGQETVVYRGFQVIGCGGGGGADLAAAAQATTVAEDPLKFKLAVRNDDPAYLVANVQGPLRSRFVSASLVANGTRFDGSVEVVTGLGCRVKFAREGIAPGVYDLLLNRGDESSLLLENSITAAPAPTGRPISLSGVLPNTGTEGLEVEFLVTGENLEGCGRVALVGGTTILEPKRTAGAQQNGLSCVFDLTGAPAGVYDLVVRGADGSQATLAGCFTVVQQPALVSPPPTPAPPVVPDDTPAVQPSPVPVPEPVIVSVTPDPCYSGTLVQFAVDGKGFRQDMKVKLAGGGRLMWPVGCRFASEARLECLFDLAGALPGAYQLVIVEPDGCDNPFVGAIEVIQAEARRAD